MKVYLDNASTTPLLPEVADAMYEVMKNQHGNPSSIHHFGRSARALIEKSRKTVANAINASIGEIFFTSCATEANNTALIKAVETHNVETIIHSPIEHHCVLHTIDYLEKVNGINRIVLSVNSKGQLNYEELKSHLSSLNGKALVSIMHANNEIGVINDIKTIGTICKEHQALFHCDTVQTIGKYDIDVQELDVDFASGSAHKFHGPKGIGFMYIRNESSVNPLIHGGAQERNMRAGTENIYGIVGLAKALELSLSNCDSWKENIKSLKERFIHLLKQEIDDVLINGEEEGLYHVCSVSFPPSPKGDLLLFNLDIAGISVSSGSACSSGIEKDSHVLEAIGHPCDRKTVRFSFSHLNTMEEIEYTIDKLKLIMAPAIV